VPPALEAVVLHAMRRSPENRYRAAAEIVTDLDHLDTLDPRRYDLGPEPPVGGIAAASSARRVWAYAALVAVIFLGVVAVILALSVLVH
jgi:tetrahydromethanopterin S-methyltransferase subunit B